MALLSAGCSETTTANKPSGQKLGEGAALTGQIDPKPGNGKDIVSQFAGEEWTYGTVPDAGTPADPSKAPIKIGFINTNNGAIGALPVLSDGTNAAASFINSELGGVDGHPIEILPCETDASQARSEECAKQLASQGVIAVLGGLAISSGAAVKVLEQNNIPWIGGIPLNVDEMQSKVAFQFSGGSPGAFAAFAWHAAKELKAKRVSVLYIDLPQIKFAMQDYGIALLKAYGVEVNEVPTPLTTTDWAPVVQSALSTNPEAVIVGAADFACPKVIEAIAAAGSSAQIYQVGSCADDKWLQQVGYDKVSNTLFNIEGRLDQTISNRADTEIFTAAMKKFQPSTNSQSAATIGFKSAMNLWDALDEIGPDASAADLIDFFSNTVEHRSWDGHSYTCKTEQVPALPSLCAPQQVLLRIKDATTFEEGYPDWIDVPKILTDAGI